MYPNDTLMYAQKFHSVVTWYRGVLPNTVHLRHMFWTCMWSFLTDTFDLNKEFANISHIHWQSSSSHGSLSMVDLKQRTSYKHGGTLSKHMCHPRLQLCYESHSLGWECLCSIHFGLVHMSFLALQLRPALAEVISHDPSRLSGRLSSQSKNLIVAMWRLNWEVGIFHFFDFLKVPDVKYQCVVQWSV